MKVLIIEDEAPAFRRLQKVLEEVMPEVEILDVLDTVTDTIKWWQGNAPPDLIFMDIQLSDGLSFEIFDYVEVNSPLIFTTAFDEYTLKAFKVNSIDYLLKPIKKEDVVKGLAKYQNMKHVLNNVTTDRKELVKAIKINERHFKSRFLVKIGDKLLAIETNDISTFCTKGGLVYLISKDGKKYLLDYTLDELTQQLNPDSFYRANRQYIVNFKAIQSIHKYYRGKLLIKLDIATEEQIVVSSEKAANFKKWLGEK